jgi:DNA polymerase-3 subunit alpha
VTIDNRDIKFVGLHAHTCVGSPFDGLGYPEEHFEFAYKNGMDAMAITDHGNCNSLAYVVEAAKKMNADGKTFKPIYGIEGYYHPSIKKWKEDKAKIDAENKEKKKKKEKTGADASFVLEDEEESKRQNKSIINHRRHIVLLAQNQKGLNNIFQLVTRSYGQDYYYRFPRMDYSSLKKFNEGIIASSACLGGIFGKLLWENLEDPKACYEAMRQANEEMLDIFGDRWYLELQWNDIPEQHILNNHVINLHKEYGTPIISTCDSHYPSPDKWLARELYKKLGWLKRDSEATLPSSVEELGYELYPKNGKQMWEAYKKADLSVYDTPHWELDPIVRKSLTNTYHIAHERIETFYPDNTIRLPDFVVPQGETADEALRRLCLEGLEEKGLTSPEYLARLDKELDVVATNNFSKYFLTMKEISDLAQKDRLVGSGRGSAAGALMTFSLGITAVDPIKYGLQFERFMLKDATGMPDIDFDVERPMELKEKLVEEWGEDCAVPISNFNTLQPKSLVKDIAKFYGIPFQEVNAVTSVMEEEAIPQAKAAHGIKSGAYKPTVEELIDYSTSLSNFLRKYPDIKSHLKNLVGQTRSTSRHAGGCLIGQNLSKHMPLIKSKGVTQTPWTEGQRVRHLEPMGFIKFDILGIQTLEIVDLAISLILEREHGREPTFKEIRAYYDKHLSPEFNDLDDQEVYESIFHKGRFAATFQFTEEGAQNFCTAAKPRSIVDISTITAIYRPGPLSAKVDAKYLLAQENPNSISYPHPSVEGIMKETLGFLVYQEQISAIANTLGKDIDLNEGNKLRKLLTKTVSVRGKRVPSEKEEAIRAKFVAGCLEKGLTRMQAKEIWDNFIGFAAYGFCKSHSVCYSVLSYQCAWLLHYHPDEWFSAYLTFASIKERELAISLAKQFGYRIGSLCINRSGLKWHAGVENGEKVLYPPLTSIKGIGEPTVRAIIRHRPFKKIEDFMFHPGITGRELGKKHLDAFTRAGALNVLIDERFTGDKHFWTAVAVDKPKNEKKLLENIQGYASEGGFSRAETILNIQSLTGNYPIGMVLDDDKRAKFKAYGMPALGNWEANNPDHRSKSGLALCWFIPIEKIEKLTKRNRPFWILKVVDETGTISEIKCWGVKKHDHIFLHTPYMAAIEADPKWGFSTKGFANFKPIL